MNNIKNLINLKPNENVLGVFSDEAETQIYKNHLNEEYHNLENLPKSFFLISNDKIIFKYVRIITNLRIIILGVNFWQLFDPFCQKKKELMDIQNYSLSIEKNHLRNISLEIDLGSNVLYFNNLVKIRCFSNNQYQELSKIIIEHWGYTINEFNEVQTKGIDEYVKDLRFYNLFQFIINLIIFTPLLLKILTSEYYHVMVLVFFISSIGFLLFSLIVLFFIVNKKRRYNFFLNITIRFILLILFLMNLLILTMVLPFSKILF